MNGNLAAQLHSALLDAFDDAGLARLVQFHLDADLDSIVSGNQSRSARVLELVQWTKAQGKLDRLLVGALAENPSNAQLRALFEPLSEDEAPTRLQTAATQAAMMRRQYDELAAIRRDVEELRSLAMRPIRSGHYIAGLLLLYTGTLLLTHDVQDLLQLTFPVVLMGVLFVWIVAAYLLLYSRGSVE